MLLPSLCTQHHAPQRPERRAVPLPARGLRREDRHREQPRRRRRQRLPLRSALAVSHDQLPQDRLVDRAQDGPAFVQERDQSPEKRAGGGEGESNYSKQAGDEAAGSI